MMSFGKHQAAQVDVAVERCDRPIAVPHKTSMMGFICTDNDN
jgi:hypothetical protein